jgi:nucleoside-diphosphate-sugar epimerase
MSVTDAVTAGADFYIEELLQLNNVPTLQTLNGTVVCVGATGLLGTAAGLALSSIPSVEFIGIARKVRNSRPGVRVIAGSAIDPRTFVALPPADYVLYIAGTTNDSFAGLWESVDVTLTGLRHATEYARRSRSKRFVFVSSTRVYGPRHDCEVITEDTLGIGAVMSVGNVYDSSKRLAESLLLAEHEKCGLPVSIIRLANLYGPHLSNPRGHFMGEILSSLAVDRRVALRGHPDSTRNYCFVTDAVQGMLRAMAVTGAGRAYNIGSSEHRSNLEFIRQLADQLPFETQIDVPQAALASPCSRTTLSIERARQELDYEPRGTLDRCLPYAAHWTLEALGLV